MSFNKEAIKRDGAIEKESNNNSKKLLNQTLPVIFN